MYGQITDPMQLMAEVLDTYCGTDVNDMWSAVESMCRLFYDVSKRVAEQVIVNLIRNNEGISKAGGIHNGIDQGLHEG